MDPLSGPFPAKVPDSMKMNENKKLSINTTFNSRTHPSAKNERTPKTQASHPSPSITQRSFKPQVLPEPILMPPPSAPNLNDSASSHSHDLYTQSLPEEGKEILRSCSNSETSSSSSSASASQLQRKDHYPVSQTEVPTLETDTGFSGNLEHSVWSDDEDEEVVKDEVATASSLFASFRSRPSTESLQLLEAGPVVESEDHMGAKARKVLGLSRSPSSIKENRRNNKLLSGFGGRRNSLGSDGITFSSSSLKSSLSFKRKSQAHSPRPSLPSASSSPRSSTAGTVASPSSATREAFGTPFQVRKQVHLDENSQCESPPIKSVDFDQLDWSVSSLKNSRPSSDLKKQTSFNSISDYITSFKTAKSPPHSQGSERGRKLYVTPLNLPSPEAVRQAGRAQGRVQGRPSFDPNPLPPWASRSNSISSEDQKETLGRSNLSRSESSSRPASRPSSSTAVQVFPTPPRPARSHLRSASDSKNFQIPSPIRTEKKLSGPSSEVELLSSSSPPWSPNASFFASPSSGYPGCSSSRLDSSPSIFMNASPEPALSHSSSSPRSGVMTPPPASSAFLSLPRSAPEPPSRASSPLSSTSHESSSGSGNGSVDLVRGPISSLKAVKKMSSFFVNNKVPGTKHQPRSSTISGSIQSQLGLGETKVGEDKMEEEEAANPLQCDSERPVPTDVPRPISLASQSSLDLDFDFDFAFEPRLSLGAPQLPIPKDIDDVRRFSHFSSSEEDVLDTFKIQGF